MKPFGKELKRSESMKVLIDQYHDNDNDNEKDFKAALMNDANSSPATKKGKTF